MTIQVPGLIYNSTIYPTPVGTFRIEHRDCPDDPDFSEYMLIDTTGSDIEACDTLETAESLIREYIHDLHNALVKFLDTPDFFQLGTHSSFVGTKG